MEVYGTERGVKRRWNREFWAVPVSLQNFFFFFFSLRRDAVSPCSEKPKTKNIFPWRSSLLLTHTHDFPHFQCFTCKNVSYRIQKSKQSVLSPSFFFFFFFFFCFHTVLHWKIRLLFFSLSVALFSFFLSFFFLILDVFLSWIQNSSPSVATCVVHPLCPSIWPQWYEEARCSWTQRRKEFMLAALRV